MRDEARREFEKRIRDLPNRRIEAEMEEWAYDSEERSILRRELEERRRAKDAPKERRHQDLKRLHWFAAVVSLIGAAASWAAVWFQWHRSPPPAAPANPLAAISPVPTPQESSAVTSPAATPEEAVPPPEEAVPPPEEAVPPPEEAVPPPEEAVPPLEEAVPPLEEAVPPPEEAVLPPEEPPVTSPVPTPEEP
jgi:cytoskeletal protein RodZ